MKLLIIKTAIGISLAVLGIFAGNLTVNIQLGGNAKPERRLDRPTTHQKQAIEPCRYREPRHWD